MRGVARRSSFGFLGFASSAARDDGESVAARSAVARAAGAANLMTAPLYAWADVAAMVESSGLKLGPSASVKEKRLAALLAGRDPNDPAREAALVSAQA